MYEQIWHNNTGITGYNSAIVFKTTENCISDGNDNRISDVYKLFRGSMSKIRLNTILFWLLLSGLELLKIISGDWHKISE